VTDGAAAAMEAETRSAIDDALRFAEESPEPDPASLLDGVYA